MPSLTQRSGVRLAELVALLSLGTDLGLGQPMEHMIRACLIALRMGDEVGLDESQHDVVFYSGLLAWVGCHTDAYEQAKWFGDDISLKRDAHYAYDMGSAGQASAMLLKHLGGEGRPVLERARLGLRFLGEGREALAALAENHYRATDQLAAQLGLSDEVRAALVQSYERWDGKGPKGLRGADSLLSARLINLADVVEVFRRTGGIKAALAVARERSGTHFDPGLVEVLCDRAASLLGDLDVVTSWDALIDVEPTLGLVLPETALDHALEAIGDFADMKSPWTIGHTHGVSELAEKAARSFGLQEGDVVALRRAALVQDIGRLGVSNAVWDKRGPLTQAEMERVRLHPYLTERMLAYSAALASLGAVAVQHHERLDGSGYPHGLSGATITPGGRILGAADAYQAMISERPHRPAHSPGDAAALLRAEVAAGRIHGGAAEAVLEAAGHRTRAQQDWPSGLTSREVEVLRLVAIGLSNKEIARRLFISPKTAGSHVEHIYQKIDAANRVQASLFAVRQGLMGAT